MMGTVARGAVLVALVAMRLNAQSPPTETLGSADGFTGSKACYGCHGAIYRSFQKTDMGRSMTLASEWKPDALPAEARMIQQGTGRIFEVFHNESGWQQKESEPGVFTVEHQLEYVVGSGANGLTFLIRRGNYLFQAPLSFYSRTKKWDFSPGYESVDLGFGRAIPQECIDCHAGRAAPMPNQPGAFGDPPFQELAIGCENCHGAGGAHVRSLGKQIGSIVNPAKLAPRLAENICMNCHQSGDARVFQAGKDFGDFHPGQWLFDTAVILKRPSQNSEQQESDLLEHYSAMQASRCFRGSNGKMGCLTCHDPHVQPRRAEVPEYFRAKCLGCHNDRSCSLPLKARREQNPPDDCVECHMPKRNVLQVSHSALTNHRIPARNGEPIPPTPARQVDGLIVVDAPPNRAVQLSKVTLLRAYGQLSAQNPEYQRRYLNLLDELSREGPQDPFVQSALGHKALLDDRPEEAVTHLRVALALNNSTINLATVNLATVNLEMGQALAKLGRDQEAIGYLKEAVELDPYNAVAEKTLILQYINLKAYPEARRHMEQYVEEFPEDSFMRNLLARVSK